LIEKVLADSLSLSKDQKALSKNLKNEIAANANKIIYQISGVAFELDKIPCWLE